MIKVAFIKFGGLAAGGTERYLQTIAANLPKSKFAVDFYYCDAAPYLGSNWKHPNTDPFRKKYLEDNKVNLIQFNVQYKDVRTPTHDWVNTNFWDIFYENKYNVICTGRAGHPEYPYNKINKTPIINILTLVAGVDNQANIFKSIHISKQAGNQWIKMGGDPNKLEIIPPLQEMPDLPISDLRQELNLIGKFVYGFHQRNDDHIFSELPLLAYEKIKNSDTAFLMLGGGDKYQNQANKLEIENFIKLNHSGNSSRIHSFLATLDVFAHGRNDGETFGMVIAEAMYHKKPIISHLSINNGHIETMGDGGRIFKRDDIEGYSKEMLKLKKDKKYYDYRSTKGWQHFNKNHSIHARIRRMVEIFEQAT